MKNDRDKTIAFLKYLQINPDIEDYESRFRIQKTMAILKSMGAPIDYRFELKNEGPYSKGLSSDYYHYKTQFVERYTDYVITKADKTILNRFLNTMDEDRRSLEAVSTILFKKLEYQDLETTSIKIREIKPHLLDREIMFAQNKAKELMFKDEFVTQELSKEQELWEKADECQLC